LDDYGLADLKLLAQAHGFAGGALFAPSEDSTASTRTTSQWLGDLTWHHVLTDYQVGMCSELC